MFDPLNPNVCDCGLAGYRYAEGNCPHCDDVTSMPDPHHKSYLGDGAYVRLGSYDGEVVLATSDGFRDTNTVVLGPTETRNLLDWLFERGLDVKLSRLEERVRELEDSVGDLENPI